MASQKERAFRRKISGLIKNANRLKDTEVKKIIQLLNAARRDVAATVASTEWQAYRLPQMKAAIERAMQTFGDKYGVDLRDAQREFWGLGVDMTDLPLREVGISVAIPEIDTTVLSVMQGFSSDLVTGLTQDAVKKINTELTLGLMGQKSPYEVMETIGRNLKDKSIFKSIAHRADTIVRTEAGRVLEAAGQARKEAAAAAVPGLQKQWYYGHSPKMPRLDHMAADGQIRDVDEPFNVGGEQLMYPRDPAGSPGNTINCGCTSLPYHPSWDEAAKRQAANF
ncbi:phage head morphogenesis protein [Patescibacteria group bacterium]|nr:phage head morphogenesis protein [Patescibacteria group bacterium]